MAIEYEQNIELVELVDVQDDESWATDKNKVAGFQAVLQQGKRFPTLLLRRVWHEDASYHYEIIDGFHRFRALVAEGVKSYPAMIVECDDRTADYDRIQASLDKPDPILHQRAEQAIRQRFIKDMAAEVTGKTLYERTLDEDGHVIPMERTEPLPDDPFLVLQVLFEHFAAQTSKYKPDDPFMWRGEIIQHLSTWEQHIGKWMEEISKWLGKSVGWLHQQVDISFWRQHGGVWGDLVSFVYYAVPDKEIRTLILGRMKMEGFPRPEPLTEILCYLGVVKITLSGTQYVRVQRTRREIVGLLASHTLEELWKKAQQANEQVRLDRQREAAAEWRQNEIAESKRIVENWQLKQMTPEERGDRKPKGWMRDPDDGDFERAGISVPQGTTWVPRPSAPLRRDRVFATVSSKFAKPQSNSPVEAKPIDQWPSICDIMHLLMRRWEIFHVSNGDWTREEVRADLEQIIAAANGYLNRR